MNNIYTGAARVKTAKLFKNGDSQAVRLPREFRFEGNEVLIRRVGDAVVLLPLAKSWDALIGSLGKFTPDFMEQRRQPERQKRELLG
jgi:antitoxin VapB